MQHYEDLKTLVQDAEADFRKFYEKGNAAAGTRVRKVMQDLKGLATTVRKDVTERKVIKG